MTCSRIFLVGFMGAGKTTVGKLLAQRLDWEFIDLDREIERSEGRSIADIFRHSGEPRFRELERQHLQRHSSAPRAVIALGGGAFADESNRQLAHSSGLTVWLKVSFPIASTRAKIEGGTRPLFDDANRAEHLFAQREDLYKLAHLHTDTDNRRPDEIVGDILGALSNI